MRNFAGRVKTEVAKGCHLAFLSLPVFYGVAIRGFAVESAIVAVQLPNL